MQTQKTRLSAKNFLAILMMMAAVSNATAHEEQHDPFEPRVTREESALLGSAMKVAETNINQAIKMISAKGLKTASPAMDFTVANLQFQSGRLDDAARAYCAALEKLPKFRGAIMNLGRVYLMLERTPDAIELYQRLVVDGQADADILLLLGHALLMEKAPVSAESAYRQSLLLRPKHADTMLGLAKAVMQQERYAEGLALVGEVLCQNPVNRELWSLRVDACLSMGKYVEAMRTIEKARRLDCADAAMLATLGDLLINQDQPEDALHAYDAAFAVEQPSIARMLRAIEGFLMVGNRQGARSMIANVEAAFEKKTETAGDARQTMLLRLKAELAQQAGEFADAMALCSEILKLDPLDGRTMLILARLQQEAGLLEDAAMTCERAVRVKDSEAEALVRHAQIEVQRERYGHAVSLLEGAQAFDDRPHVARYLEQVRRMVE